MSSTTVHVILQVGFHDRHSYSKATKLLCTCVLVPITLEAGIYSSKFYSFLNITLPSSSKALILSLFLFH